MSDVQSITCQGIRDQNPMAALLLISSLGRGIAQPAGGMGGAAPSLGAHPAQSACLKHTRSLGFRDFR